MDVLEDELKGDEVLQLVRDLRAETTPVEDLLREVEVGEGNMQAGGAMLDLLNIHVANQRRVLHYEMVVQGILDRFTMHNMRVHELGEGDLIRARDKLQFTREKLSLAKMRVVASEAAVRWVEGGE
jgi:hypothetical protein